MTDLPFTIPEDVSRIINKYYPTNSLVYKFYFTHCVMVTELCLKLANANEHLLIDQQIVIKGGMLHDIGIIKTNAPEIGCYGEYPYIAHTYLGREILENEGLFEIAPVCERHIGMGLTVDDIIRSGFPLPHRNMVPISIEEKLICYADKFYSKTEKHLTKPKSLETIRKKVSKYGEDKLQKFEEFSELFGIEGIYG